MLKKCCETWCKGLNIQRFIFANIAVFFWMVAADMFITHMCLMDTYQQTPELWRPVDEIQANVWWMLLAYFILAKVFVYIFTRGYEGKGWAEGARYGLLIGLFAGVSMAMSYIWMPIWGLCLFCCLLTAKLCVKLNYLCMRFSLTGSR